MARRSLAAAHYTVNLGRSYRNMVERSLAYLHSCATPPSPFGGKRGDLLSCRAICGLRECRPWLRGRTPSDTRRLAILGALVTGAAGVIMAVFAVVTGEEMGGGALLAASALAFGLLAINVDRTIGQRALNPSPALLKPRGDSSEGNLPGSEKVAPPDVDPITEREREVLSFVAEGTPTS